MSEDNSILTRSAPPPWSTLTYGRETDQLADIWPGAAGAAHHPLLLFIHGGYWRAAYDRAHMAPMAAAIAAFGWTAVNIEYRRVPGNPSATLEDISRAVGFLPSRVRPHDGTAIVIGFSAGGHLALWLAQSNAHAKLRSVLALAPVADLRLASARELGDGAVRAFLGTHTDLLTGIDPRNMPDSPVPVTIVHGASDDVVPIELSESYVAAHPSARLRRMPMTGHFALVDPATHAWPIVLQELQNLAAI